MSQSLFFTIFKRIASEGHDLVGKRNKIFLHCKSSFFEYFGRNGPTDPYPQLWNASLMIIQYPVLFLLTSVAW